jgi:excisionase family DNA binding protein
MPRIDSESLLTASELAERLVVQPGTILGWHRAGRIPARRLSHKTLRFDLADVLAALESGASPTEADGRGVDQ